MKRDIFQITPQVKRNMSENLFSDILLKFQPRPTVINANILNRSAY